MKLLVLIFPVKIDVLWVIGLQTWLIIAQFT